MGLCRDRWQSTRVQSVVPSIGCEYMCAFTTCGAGDSGQHWQQAIWVDRISGWSDSDKATCETWCASSTGQAAICSWTSVWADSKVCASYRVLSCIQCRWFVAVRTNNFFTLATQTFSGTWQASWTKSSSRETLVCTNRCLLQWLARWCYGRNRCGPLWPLW